MARFLLQKPASYPPVLTELNNGILNSRGAMPLKDSTSDGTDFFANSRYTYRRSFDPNPATNQINPNDPKIGYDQSQSGAFGGVSRMFFSQMSHSTNLPREVPRYQNQKKWIGGNRDASQIIAKKRNNSIGVGSLNANGQPTSFVSNTNKNVVQDAKIRARNAGASVPAKSRSRLLNRYSGLTQASAPRICNNVRDNPCKKH